MPEVTLSEIADMLDGLADGARLLAVKLRVADTEENEELSAMRNKLAALIWQLGGVTLTEEAKAAIATRVATSGVNIHEGQTPGGWRMWLDP